MAKFRFFYDYECPFCKRAYEELMDLLPAYPGMEVEWRPVEAHPRPENVWPHSDLCIEAYYIAVELGADVDAFHRAMFRAVITERQDVENNEVLAKVLKGIMDRGKFLEILESGKYTANVNENNALAYEENDVWYVPAFRLPGNNLKTAAEGKLSGPDSRSRQQVPRLDARGGVGVNRKEIKNFLDLLN